MKIRLNLSTAPLENNRRFWLATALVGALALGAFLGLARTTYRNRRASRELREEISRLRDEIREFREQREELKEFFESRETRRVMERAAFLNSLIQQRSFPWTKVFMDLERRLPEGVRVVSISPRMREGRVELKLVIGAAGDEGKLEFLKTLEESREFSRVQVTSETRPERGESGDHVVLELVAWYTASE
jgi:Tfp pilus assembly protein PilN